MLRIVLDTGARAVLVGSSAHHELPRKLALGGQRPFDSAAAAGVRLAEISSLGRASEDARPSAFAPISAIVICDFCYFTRLSAFNSPFL